MIFYSIYSVYIEHLDAGLAADKAGLKIGDRILRIDNVDLKNCTRDDCLKLFQNAGLNLSLVIFPSEMLVLNLKTIYEQEEYLK